MKIAIVIPARYTSTRLPGKPLIDILGKPMIQHVYEQAKKAACADTVVVATDDQRIVDAVTAFGGRAVMTSDQHPSGTDRIIEVAESVKADIYINVQGDEPLIKPSDIDLVAKQLTDDNTCQVATLCHPISAAEAQDSNTVKVVFSHSGKALYFSRSPIPFGRDEKNHSTFYKHIGIYGYRYDVLQSYGDLAASDLESLEKLEQLRLLQADIAISVKVTEKTGPGVDTPLCVETVKAILNGEKEPETKTLNEKLKEVKLVITDIDGVLTDGKLYYSKDGEALKPFHVRDGIAVKMLQFNDITVAVASGKASEALKTRISELGIFPFIIGEIDKKRACEHIFETTGVPAEQAVYIGDDTIDIDGFNVCGISFAVGDAPMYVKEQADVQLKNTGGNCAFRECAEMILKAKGLSHVYESPDGFKQSVKKAAQ